MARRAGRARTVTVGIELAEEPVDLGDVDAVQPEEAHRSVELCRVDTAGLVGVKVAEQVHHPVEVVGEGPPGGHTWGAQSELGCARALPRENAARKRANVWERVQQRGWYVGMGMRPT